jgi:DNA-binding transcriptional ArsR family regulator
MDMFSALAVPIRRDILEILSKNGKLSATEIVRRFSISAPAISQHLRVLREAELLTVETRAQRRIYSINPQKITEVQSWAANTVEQWERRLDSLDALLENAVENKQHHRRKHEK